jgi:hypothetical protein
MCPDLETLLAFYDGEIEAPFSAQVAGHVESCASCKAKLAEFGTLSSLLALDPEPDSKTGMEAVRLSVNALSRQPRIIRTPFWKKKIDLPLPVAGIAAIALVFLGFAAVFNLSQPNANPYLSVKAQPDSSGYTEVKIPVKNEELEALLKSLENPDANREVIFQIPDESKTFQFGEPTLIKASDRKNR